MAEDPRTEFAAEVADLATQLLGARTQVLHDEFSLRIVPPDAEPAVLHLETLFAETQLLTDQERGLRIRAALWAATPEPRPQTWPDAMPHLLPAIRRSTSLGPDVVRRPLLPFIDVALTLDLGHSISFVIDDDLATWGMGSSETAYAAASRNLLEAGLEVEEIEAAFAITRPDSYASSWIALPELLGSVSEEIDGPLIALAPTRDVLRLVRLGDVEGVTSSIERALTDFREEPRSISPAPYVFVDDEVRPWEPPRGHPAHELVRQANRLLADRAYGELQDFLRSAFEEASDPTRVASHILVTHKDDGHMWSWALWSAEPGDSLIPKVDYVLVSDPDGVENPFAVGWQHFTNDSRGKVRHETGYPAPLWRSSGPTSEFVEELKRFRTEFPPIFDRVMSCG